MSPTPASPPPFFSKVICDDPNIIRTNIVGKKKRSPDYVGVETEEAIADFTTRIAHYEQAYQTLETNEGSYIKLINVGKQFETNRIYG